MRLLAHGLTQLGDCVETARLDCFICKVPGVLAYEAKIDENLVSEFTFASRKEPELMHYEYFRCPKCDLLFSTTLPDQSELIHAYEEAAFDAAVESKYAAKDYIRAIRRGIKSPIKSLLDVGCGDAEFMLACESDGITKIQGIEPSPAASQLAPERLHGGIFQGGYEDFSSTEKFDLVTLFQTVEHIEEPIGFLEIASSLTHPGGYIAIACHDRRSFVNRILGEKSPIFDIEHLQIFTQQSIREAMSVAGLTEITTQPYKNTYPLSYWMRLAPVPGWLKRSKLLTATWVGKLPIRLPLGNIMAIGRVSS